MKSLAKVCLAILILICTTPSWAAQYATYYTTASCQREGTNGVWTASGSRYDEEALTCALPRRDFGKSYLVYSESTNRSVVVKHTDYGPGKGPRKRGVAIDLTPKAFKAVCGDLSLGQCAVNIQEVL